MRNFNCLGTIMHLTFFYAKATSCPFSCLVSFARQIRSVFRFFSTINLGPRTKFGVFVSLIFSRCHFFSSSLSFAPVLSSCYFQLSLQTMLTEYEVNWLLLLLLDRKLEIMRIIFCVRASAATKATPAAKLLLQKMN